MRRFHVIDTHEWPQSRAAEGVVWADGSVTTYWRHGGHSHTKSMELFEPGLVRVGYRVSWVDPNIGRPLTAREDLERDVQDALEALDQLARARR
ncbi:hypothetical protein [Mycolicibacterium sp.]|uniref:hypothetical protein n=1 Tax=Mycolicibacterium sp. TaxID=2320850 RepID=UPI0037CB8EE2